MNASFSEQIHFFVQRRNLPVEQLATLSNISRKTLYRWVNGEVERPRHWSQIVALGKALRLNEDEVDQLLWVTRNPAFRELKSLARYEYELELLEEFTAAEPLNSDIPRPKARYGAWTELEAPTGAVGPESPFYIIRAADDRLREQIIGKGTTTTIQAGRQTGKTSLLMQAIHTARHKKGQVIYLDFQLVDENARADFQSLLHYLTEDIAEQLDLDWELVDSYWSSARNPAHTFTRFVQREVLGRFDSRILLAIDEADLLLDSAFKKHFFALLRAWDSRRAFDDDWRKLNLVMVISTHPYLLIDDVNLSPFNVGLTIHLRDFNLAQVADLNQRHNAPLPAAEVEKLMALVGGHPYLVRQSLYTLAQEEIGLRQLVDVACDADGPFGKHLHFYRRSLNESPAMKSALQQLLGGKEPQDEEILERLAAVGLVKQVKGRWTARCGLYETYFRREL